MGGGGSWNPVTIIENTVSSAGDMLSSIDPGPAIGDAGVAIDKAVNDTVPGGWATVGAVAVAIAAPYALPALAETGAGFVGLDAATAAELGLSGGSALGTAGAAGDVLAGIAGLEGAGAATSAGAGGVGALDLIGESYAVPGVVEGAGGLPIELLPEMIPEAIPMELTPEMIPEGIPQDPGISLEQAQMGDVQYPGDSQYEVQDVQEQARATDVKPGSPTSWDTGESLIPQELKDAFNAANKARQAYNIGRALLGGTGGAMTMPTLGQYITPGMGMGAGSTGIQNMGIPNLQAGLVRGQPVDLNIDQFNAPLAPINAAEGGYIQHYAAAGEVDSYVDTNYQDTVTGLAKLKPNLMKGKSDFGLQKYWNPPAEHADGGSIEGHNPEFFSEGGLQNRYVKGAGDGTSDDVPAMLANGEFVIPADVVSSLGNGSNDSGAHLLDEFLQVIREHKRKADAKDLPPDSKGPLGYLLEAKRKAR